MLAKYWKSVVIMMVIVLAVGVFYGAGTKHSRQLALKKVKGDNTVAQSMVVNGSVSSVGAMSDDRFQVSTDGTTFRSDASYFDQLAHDNFPVVAKLRKNYRHFMRMKGYEPSTYYEDHDHLAYGDIATKQTDSGKTSSTFKIAVLDKKSGDTHAFQLPFATEKDSNFYSVNDVQLRGNELQMFVQQFIHGDVKVHVYRFDLAKEKLLADTIITSPAKTKKDETIDITTDFDTKYTAKHRYFVLKETISKEKMITDTDSVVEPLKVNVIAYDYQTGKSKTLKLPEKWQKDLLEHTEDMNLSLHKSTLYFMVKKGDQITVRSYDVQYQKPKGKMFTIPAKGDDIPTFTMKGKYLYTLMSGVKANRLGVVDVTDVTTGKTIYKGEVVTKHPSDEQSVINLYNIEVK